MAIFLVFVLAGCQKRDSNVNTAVESSATSLPVDLTETPTESPKINNIEWTEFTYSQKDDEGYTFDVTVKLSPWIFLSNTDIIRQAWSEVGKDKKLPDFDQWGLNKDSQGFYWSPYSHNTNNGNPSFNYGYWNYKMNDMYYCIGSVKISNTTEGWSFSKKNPHNVRVHLQCNPVKTEAFYRSDVFYNNTNDPCWNGVDINAKMKKNNWGSVPFIIMCPENFSPEDPNGKYLEKLQSGSLEVYQRRDIEPMYLTIIGKDGETFRQENKSAE